MVQTSTATGSLPSNLRRIATRTTNHPAMPAAAHTPKGTAARFEGSPTPLA
jgi:hypothetical protein